MLDDASIFRALRATSKNGGLVCMHAENGGAIDVIVQQALAEGKKAPHVQLLGSGTILREVLAGADLLAQDFGVLSDVWSVTSFNQLRRDGLDVQRWNLLHPELKQRAPYVAQCLAGHDGPVVAATDYVKVFSDQIRGFIDRRYHALGTDGFGRSDYRRKLRAFFEVDRHWVALAALKNLAEEGTIPRASILQAIKKYELDPSKPNPVTV